MDTIKIQDFVGLGGVFLIQSLVAFIKTTFPSLPARYYPGVSVTIGVILNEVLCYILQSDPRIGVVVGVVAGLAACGLFHYGKSQDTPTAIAKTTGTTSAASGSSTLTQPAVPAN